MSLGTFTAIIDKAQQEGKIRRVMLYSWSDPLLHKQLPAMVRCLAGRRIPVDISTTLNKVNCNIDDLMLAGISKFSISFSGFDQYHITHRGGDLGTVLTIMKYISKLPRTPQTRIVLLFHRYKHNLHEEAKAKKLAHELGFEFCPYDAKFCGGEKIVRQRYTKKDIETIKVLRNTPEAFRTERGGRSIRHWI